MGRNWSDLIVWKESHEVVKLIYDLLKKFPKDENFILVAQIKRAAISIPTNIVEGHSKNSQKDFLKFLYISRGSLEELKYLLYLAKDLGYIDDINHYDNVNGKLSKIGVMLNKLINSIQTITNHN